MTKFIDKTLRRLRCFLIRNSAHPRASSSPYISGDTFRSFAQHLYDETHLCVGRDIQKNDIVFVKADYLDDFFSHIHPSILFPYILISHNSDRNIITQDLQKIDEKIIHWFAQNVTTKHPKLTPLPIGLENRHLSHHGRISKFKKWNKYMPIKKPRILSAFSVSTNIPERSKALIYLKNHPLVDNNTIYISSQKHMTLLAQHMYVASPPGNGIDCIRTWEALYLKTIPIVKRSVATEYFKKIGLPLVLIDDWNELDMVDEPSLITQYNNMKEGFENKALSSSFWKQLIETTRLHE